MTSLCNRILPAVAACALALSACGSSAKTSDDSASTTTSTVAESTTVDGATTSATTPPTTAKPVTQTTKAPTTNPPATNPPATTAEIFTSFSVSNAAACTDPSATFQPPPPSVTVSWTVVGADSVNLLIDGGLWGTYGTSGSETLPASCDSNLHNVHTYSAVAIKNGQQIATKSATRGS